MTVLVNKTFTEEDVSRIKDKVGRVKLGYVERKFTSVKSWIPFKTSREVEVIRHDSTPAGITEFYLRPEIRYQWSLRSRELEGFGDLCEVVRRFDKGDRSFCVGTDVLDLLQLIEEWDCD